MSARARSLLVLILTVLTLTGSGSLPARAQTAPVQSPPTTKGLVEGIISQLLPPPTPPPTPAPPRSAPPPTAVRQAPPPPAPTTTTLPPRVVPPEFQRIINSVRRTGPRSTTALLDALRRLEDLGFTAEESAIRGMGRFPVAGPADYTDDWLHARFGPPFHLHKGTDIFADRGTPVLAPADGIVRFVEEGALGGRSAYVTTGDGTFYYMTHLNSFSRSHASGARVKQGDVIAFVGDTGNATGTPHLHFEIHPGGGEAVNPKPFLDAWLNDAVAAVPALLASFNVNVPRALAAAGFLRRFEAGPLSGSSAPATGALLWASSVSSGGGTLRLAELQALRVAGRVDWDSRASLAQTRADASSKALRAAGAVLVPVTPPAVVALLGATVSRGSS